jgi:uncharacterized protein (DUF433 family)
MISERDLRDRIVSQPDRFNGEPYLATAQVPVADVLQILARGTDPGEVFSRYPGLGKDDLRACLEFASSKLKAALETQHTNPAHGSSKVDWKVLQSRFGVSDEFLDAAQTVFERHDEILRRLA